MMHVLATAENVVGVLVKHFGRSARLGVVSAFAIVLGVGCGGGEDPGASNPGTSGDCEVMPTGDVLPFATGYKWTYDVTDEDGTSTKTNTIQGEETIGYGENKELKANKVLTEKKNASDKTESWQKKDGDKVVRYREDSFGATSKQVALIEYWNPYKIHIDWTEAHLADTTGWGESYSETKLPQGDSTDVATLDEAQTDHWQVVSQSECVSLPAGKDATGAAVSARKALAIHYRKVSGSSSNIKDYLYVRGVGKVKETSGSSMEVLTSFDFSGQ